MNITKLDSMQESRITVEVVAAVVALAALMAVEETVAAVAIAAPTAVAEEVVARIAVVQGAAVVAVEAALLLHPRLKSDWVLFSLHLL